MDWFCIRSKWLPGKVVRSWGRKVRVRETERGECFVNVLTLVRGSLSASTLLGNKNGPWDQLGRCNWISIYLRFRQTIRIFVIFCCKRVSVSVDRWVDRWSVPWSSLVKAYIYIYIYRLRGWWLIELTLFTISISFTRVMDRQQKKHR